MKKYRIVDLFAGCGGLSDGFEQTGVFETVASVEWEKAPCDTLVRRLATKWKYADAGERVLRFDMQRTKELIEGWKNDPEYGTGAGLKQLTGNGNDIDAVIGGPPCQAYSLAGRIRDEHGMHNDYRNYLFEHYIELVTFLKPAVFVFENVPGMLSASPGGISVIKRIKQSFGSAGYELIDNLKDNTVIDFTAFGVPQRRTRVILLGLKRSVFGQYDMQKLLRSFYSEMLGQYRTGKSSDVAKAIGDLPKIVPADADFKLDGRIYSHKPVKSNILNHYPRYHSRRDISIFRELAHDLETKSNKYDSIEKIKELYTERTGRVSNIHKYYVLRWNEPSNTIPAHLHKDGLRHIHPDYRQARSITVREAARLQTFDDDFEFLGSMGDQYKMIGNAVPPRFSHSLAKAVAGFLENYFS